MATYPTATIPNLPTVTGKVITNVDKNGLNPIANMVIKMFDKMHETFTDALNTTTTDASKGVVIPANFLSSEYDNKVYFTYRSQLNFLNRPILISANSETYYFPEWTNVNFVNYTEDSILYLETYSATSSAYALAEPKYINNNNLYTRNFNVNEVDINSYFTEPYIRPTTYVKPYRGTAGSRSYVNSSIRNMSIVMKFAGFWTTAIENTSYINAEYYVNQEIYVLVNIGSLFDNIGTYEYNYINDFGISEHILDDSVKTLLSDPSNPQFIFSTGNRIDKNELIKLYNIVGIPFTFDSTQIQNETFTDGYDPEYIYVEKGTPVPGQGNNTTSDWTGAGDNTEDSISLSPPSVSPFADSMNLYAMNSLILNRVTNYLFTADIFNDLDLLKNDPKEGLVSCRYYPFEIRQHDPDHISTDFEEIVIGGVQMDNVSSQRILPGYNQILELGEFDIQEYFGAFLDYQLTSIDIYLPYIGWQQLNASHIMGRKLIIKYIVDLITGECTALIFSSDGSVDRLENTFNGQIGVDIPILTSNHNENVKQTASALLSGAVAVGGAVATFASGGAAAPVAMAMSAGAIANSASTIATMQNHSKLGTPIGASTSLWMPQDIIFRITRPRKSEAEEFKNRWGYRANYSTQLSNTTGFTQVEKPRLDFVATDTEKDEIKRLLQGGIYL